VRGTSDTVEFRYFRHNGIDVMYFIDKDGYVIQIEKDGVKVAGKYRLVNVNKDVADFVKALRSQGINITTEDAKEILTRVKIHDFEKREVKSLGEPPPQPQQQAQQQQQQTQQQPQQSQDEDYLGDLHVGGKTIVSIYKRPSGIFVYYPTASETEDGGFTPIQIYEGQIEAKIVRDKYLYGEARYVLKTDYKIYASKDVGEIISEFRDNDVCMKTTEKKLLEGAIRLLFDRAMKRYRGESGYVYTGFYPDGWHEGFVEYPVSEPRCDAKLIEDFLRWVGAYYGKNRLFVVGNFVLTGAKHFAPAIRMVRVFEDRVLINSGPRYLGKSTAQRRIARLYGLPPNDDYIRVVGDNAIETAPRIRNFLTRYLSAPLFFDEIGESAFKAIARFLLGSTTDSAVIGAHATHNEFEIKGARPLRSMIVNTNLERSDIEEILRDIAGPAYIRRILIYEWRHERVKREVEELYPDGNILGCLIEIWNDQNLRNEALKAKDLYHLALILTRGLMKFNINVDPIVDAIDKLQNMFLIETEEEDVEEKEPSDEELLIKRAIQLAKGKTHGPTPTMPKVLNYILHSNYIKFGTVRAKNIEEVKDRELNKLKTFIDTELGISVFHVSTDNDLENELSSKENVIDPDLRNALLTAVRNIRAGKVMVHILVGKDYLVTRAHRRFMGIERQYSGGNYYYPIPITDFIALFLRRSIDEYEETTEEVESDENNGENREPRQM